MNERDQMTPLASLAWLSRRGHGLLFRTSGAWDFRQAGSIFHQPAST